MASKAKVKSLSPDINWSNKIPFLWECTCCKHDGVFTVPAGLKETIPFDITLGIHRTISRECIIRDVTMTRTPDGVLKILLESAKTRPSILGDGGSKKRGLRGQD